MSDGVPTSYGELAAILRSLRMLVCEKRRQLQITQREVARRVGLSYSTVSRFESGMDVSLANAVRLVEWLGEL